MIVSWMTTNQCNLRCRHCYQDAGETTGGELDTYEAYRLIDQIARAGFRIMIFSGGEPLLRPDIYKLVFHAARSGLRPVFGTNGTLITREVAVRLRDCGASAMGISLDSLDEARHDAFRGVAGAWRRTLEGMEHCRAVGLPFQVHTTVLEWNRHEILPLTDFAVHRGAMGHYIFFLIPVGRGVFVEETALEARSCEELLRDIMGKQREVGIDLKPTCAPQFTRVARQMEVPTRFSQGCLAGLSYCVVGSRGRVRPCAYMTEEAGDVRLRDFGDIWRESSLFARLRTRAYSGACGSCLYKTDCGGCRARAAYYNGGDVLAQDSYCVWGRGEQLCAE